MTAKIDRLVTQVLAIVTSDTLLKQAIGDSVDNNRVPTVSQVIRFLRNNGTTVLLGNDLRRVHRQLIAKKAFRTVRRNNNRTDAYDINELVEVVENANSNVRRELGQEVIWSA